MSEAPKRVVKDSMLDLDMPSIARWSDRVTVVLGQNPGIFSGPGTNTYIVGTGDDRLLIDTGDGNDRYQPVFEKGLQTLEPAARISRMVVTHAHPDHIGGVETVRAVCGEIPVLKMPRSAWDRGIEIEVLADGDVVSVEGATLEAIWTPGHAEDHLCFLLHEEHAIFTGDVILGAGTTVIPEDGDLGDYMESLRKLRAIEPRALYPAHGPKIENATEKIDEYIAHRKLRDEQILAGLSDGPQTISTLVAGIYTDIPEFLHQAAGVSVLAHLRRFEKLGTVRALAEERWERT